MGRGLVVLAGVVVVALLLITMVASVRLVMLFVQLVTLRYTLAIGALVLTLWFVDSRRQSYAKGFYSCSRVPLPIQEKTVQSEKEKQKKEVKMQGGVGVALSEKLPGPQKKAMTAPPSETESEEDDSEAGGGGGEANVSKTVPSSTPSYRHSMSLMDVRTRSHTIDEHLQWQQATRPRSSSTSDDSRASGPSDGGKGVARSSNLERAEKKRRVVRRRADTGMTTKSKQNERLRRATFASKQDMDMTSHKLSSDKVEDALRLNGYWIGDFRVERRLATRRDSPKAK